MPSCGGGAVTEVLSVDNLTVRYWTKRGPLTALDNVSFDLFRGETLGIVGESGCGKSTLARALVGLVHPSAGSVRVLGQEIAGGGRRRLGPVRKHIQMVFQDPEASLNPRLTIGRIIEEPLLVHRIGTRADRRRQVIELLDAVGLPAAAAHLYPHEFSGGQRQRASIARALAVRPDIIVADEPASALDVSTRAQIINLLNDLQSEFGIAYVFISHDLSVVRHVADRVLVMYLGRVVESANSVDLWETPLHPYTRALLAAAPGYARSGARSSPPELLEGEPPSPLNPPSGCAFRTRCQHATLLCAENAPTLKRHRDLHAVACHHVEQIAGSECNDGAADARDSLRETTTLVDPS